MVWVKGQTGNPNGRPRRPEIQLFREALARVEKEKGVSLLVHAVWQAYKEGPVLISLLRKMLPDLIQSEGEENPLERFSEVAERLKTEDEPTVSGGSEACNPDNLPGQA